MICKKIDFTPEELKDFFFLTNMFKQGMNFDSFKKTFFLHLYLITDNDESDQERRDKEEKSQMKKNKEKQPEII